LSSKREQIRRRVLLMTVPRRLAEYPLESGMTAWGIYLALEVLFGQPPSRSLQGLPEPVLLTIGGLMLLAGLTVVTGLFFHGRSATIARGMYLFAATMVAYGSVIIGSSGWHRGGATASLVVVLGAVCLLRGWWLKDREMTIINEIVRSAESTDAEPNI
jgi:hypothetical protein